MFDKMLKPKNKEHTLFSPLRMSAFQNWLSVVFVFLALMIPVLSIEQAHWISFKPSLILTLALAVIATSLAILVRLWNKVAFVLMAVLGLLVMVWQSSAAVSRAVGQSALNAWWQTVTHTLPSENSIYFVMFLIIVTWCIGVVSVWYALKKQNAWVTVILGAVMLLINLNNLPHNYYYFFPLYLFVSLLLVFQVNLAKQKDLLTVRGDRKSSYKVIYLVVAVFIVAVLTLSVVWFSPEPPLERVGLKLNTSSLSNANPSKNWFDIFLDIQTKWPWMKSQDQAKLLFGTPLDQSDTVQYIVTSDKPAYWLTRCYDTYNSWGWTSNPTLDKAVSAGTSIVGEEPHSPDSTVTYTVENRINTDIILTTGQFVKADIPVTLKTIPSDQINTDKVDDVIAVTSPWVIGPYQSYTVVSSVPAFTAEKLMSVKAVYPDWITEHYLQLPGTLPQQVKTLSNDLTKDVTTEYEKLAAVKKYLNNFQYDEKATMPSGKEDGVSEFLFSIQKGNCLSFASSMVVMLRSVGIPARLCTGYLYGDLDKKTGKYLVRSNQYHAWAEVYFPGYGWIQCEATPDSGGSSGLDTAANNADLNSLGELPSSTQEYVPPEDDSLAGLPGYVAVSHNTNNVWIYFTVLGALFCFVVATRTVLGMRLGRLIRMKNPSDVYACMCYLASFSRAGPRAQETPLEYSVRLATVLPGDTDYIDTITQSYINVRYSPRKEMVEEYEKSMLQKSWREVCSSLVKRRLQAKKWFLIRILWRPE